MKGTGVHLLSTSVGILMMSGLKFHNALSPSLRFSPKDGLLNALLLGLEILAGFPKILKFLSLLPRIWYSFLTCIRYWNVFSKLNTTSYNAYKRSNFDQDFYEKNRANITLHETARKHFDSLGVKKLPKISELKQEYVTLQAQKKKLYVDYYELKEKSRELLIAKHNAQKILDMEITAPDATPDVKSRDTSRQSTDEETPEI